MSHVEKKIDNSIILESINDINTDVCTWIILRIPPENQNVTNLADLLKTFQSF